MMLVHSLIASLLASSAWNPQQDPEPVTPIPTVVESQWQATYPHKDELYWLTRPSYQNVSVPRSESLKAQLGGGVVMRNGYVPSMLAQAPFASDDQPTLDELLSENLRRMAASSGFEGPKEEDGTPLAVGSDAYEALNISVTDNLTIEQEAFYLHAYFKVKGGVSYRGSVDIVRNKRRERSTRFIVIDASTRVPMRKWAPPYNWPNDLPLVTESAGNEPKLGNDTSMHRGIDAFAGTYGSHYVDSMVAGWRLVASVETSKVDESLKAEISAGLSALSAKGEISAGFEKSLQDSRVSFSFDIISGGMFNADGTAYTGLPGVAGLSSFLDEYRDGKIYIRPAVTTVSLASYWPTLLSEHASSAALLERWDGDLATSAPPAIYGVPRGTVIAWNPTESDWKKNTEGVSTLVVPAGWSILPPKPEGGGVAHDFFLMGAPPTLGSTGLYGGVRTHSHSGRTNGENNGHMNDRGGDHDSSKNNHSHAFSTNNVNHIPPYYTVIWLVKD